MLCTRNNHYSIYFLIISHRTFHVLRLPFEAVQGQNDAAYQHVGVHERAVDLVQKHLKLQ